jgi:hypothetical protein
MFRITSIGRVIVYLIVISMLNRAKEKEEQEKSKVAIYQQ